MRRLAFLSVLVACGGQQAPVTDNAVRLDKPDAAVVAQPNKTLERLGIPKDAPLVATFDATALARIEPLRAEMERSFDLASGALLDNAASLGLDTKRPVTIALAPLDDAQKKLVADMRAVNGAPTDAMVQRVSGMESPFVLRILVPATNAAKLEENIGKMLHAEHWHHTASGWETHEMHVEIDDDGDNVAVDVFASRKHDPQAARAFKATAKEAPLELGDRTLRATWSPQAIASIGYLTELIRACDAVSGDSIDPSQRARILQQGFFEASRGFAVATFDRVEIEGKLSPFELVGRAKPTSSSLPADALAQAPGVAVPGAMVLAQATRAFLKGWSFPGGSPAEMLEMLRDGGFGAIFAGLPHLLAVSPELDARRSRVTLPFDLGRFDRVATSYSPSSADVFVSVLPVNTKRAAAECAFAPATPCDAKTRLKLNAPVKVGGLNAKLFEIDKRFVVVSSESEAALPTPTLVPAAGSLRLDVDTSLVAKVLAPNTLPQRLGGELSSSDGSLVFRLAPR